MNKEILQNIIKNKTHCYFISPHLDDAVFSAGGLMSFLVKKGVKVSVINVFTSSGDGKSSFSASRYLGQIGYTNAKKLYKDRVKEDGLVMRSINVDHVNLGEVDALWRTPEKSSSFIEYASQYIPEINRVYPTYRYHIIKGKISRKDNALINRLSEKISKLVVGKKSCIFVPIGCGNHKDHLIARNIIERVVDASRIIYWVDFPYVDKGYDIPSNGYSLAFKYTPNVSIKKKYCMGYKTQYHSVIGNNIKMRSEFFYRKNDIFTPPRSISKYKLEENFYADEASESYYFAKYIRLNSKQKVFAKFWYDKRYNLRYKWLLNETKIYKNLKRIKCGVIKFPKYVLSGIINGSPYLLIENIDGKNLKNLSANQKITIFRKIITDLNSINTKSLKDFPTRSPIYWAMLLPLITLYATIRNPSLARKIVSLFVYAHRNIFSILGRNNRSFVHRDFNDSNIITTDKDLYLIDFQLSCIADPLVEHAIILLKYFADIEFSRKYKNEVLKPILKDKNSEVALFVYLSIFTIYDLCLEDGDHEVSSKYLIYLSDNKKI